MEEDVVAVAFRSWFKNMTERKMKFQLTYKQIEPLGRTWPDCDPSHMPWWLLPGSFSSSVPSPILQLFSFIYCQITACPTCLITNWFMVMVCPPQYLPSLSQAHRALSMAVGLYLVYIITPIETTLAPIFLNMFWNENCDIHKTSSLIQHLPALCMKFRQNYFVQLFNYNNFVFYVRMLRLTIGQSHILVSMRTCQGHLFLIWICHLTLLFFLNAMLSFLPDSLNTLLTLTPFVLTKNSSC